MGRHLVLRHVRTDNDGQPCDNHPAPGPERQPMESQGALSAVRLRRLRGIPRAIDIKSHAGFGAPPFHKKALAQTSYVRVECLRSPRRAPREQPPNAPMGTPSRRMSSRSFARLKRQTPRHIGSPQCMPLAFWPSGDGSFCCHGGFGSFLASSLCRRAAPRAFFSTDRSACSFLTMASLWAR